QLHLAHGDAEGVGNTLAVSGIGLGAVVDVADLDLTGHAVHGAGGVAEKGFLLFGRHHPEQLAGLFVIVGVVTGILPAVGVAGKLQRRLGEIRLILPRAVAVGLVVGVAAVVAVNAHLAVAVVA